MGFSLAGFGAGLAESMVERIEEERKFSNLALQGRIERASVLKLQQEKQAREMEEELRSRKAELIQLGVTDPDLQKAYLFSPVVFEALKKARASEDPDIKKIDAESLIKINRPNLEKLTGTADEFISNVVRAKQQVEPAKLLEPAGKPSFFAPSTSTQRTRFGQLAAARGLTLEDVARAESGIGPKMPEPVGSLNVEAFPKKAEKELTPDQKAARLEARAIEAEMKFGKTHPAAIDARTAFNNFTTIRRELTPPQADYAQTMAKYKHIVRAPQNYTEEQVREARQYLDNDEKERKKYADRNEPYPLDPTKESAYRNLFRRSANSAVLRTFGRKKDWKIINQTDPETGRIIGQTSQYDGQLPQELVEQHLLFTEQQAILEAAKQSGYVRPDNTVVNPLVRGALSEFFFKFDGNKVIAPKKPEQSLDVEVKTGPRTLPPATPPASAAPAPAASAPRTPGPGRAGQGAAAAAPRATSAAVAEPKTQAEFDALQPGTPYINPKDRQVYIKK